MSEQTMATVPDARTVWGERFRTAWIGTRRELIGGAVILGVPSLAAAAWAVWLSEHLTLDPSEGYGWMLGLAGVLFPLAVWKDEDRFGDSQLWVLPYDRRRHALMNIGAGWVLLMAFVAAAMAWMVTVVLVTGGTLGAEETRLLLLDRALAEAGAPGGTEAVQWSTGVWQWIVPFTAATIAYLIGSALLLATPRPWWWVGGVFLLVMVLGVVTEEMDVANELFERVVFGPVFHPLGLDTVMTGGWDSLTTAFQRSDGSWQAAWRAMPSPGRWIVATGIWAGLGAVGIWAASLRHRDG